MTRNSSIYAVLLIIAGILSHPMSVGFHVLAQHFARVIGEVLR